ncbi:MAG: response regulator transcription factor [Pseudomonadota bacterium]
MRIAVLEDDQDQAVIVQRWLEGAGHSCSVRDRGDTFLRMVLHESFDLLLMDWMMPSGASGLEIMQRVRESGRDYTPVLMTTARDEEADIVAALTAGADDYMVKPLRRSELLARVGALVRLARGGRADDELPDTSPYSIDLDGKRISLAGEAITLTHREFDLAVFLFVNAGRALSRGHILESIWGMPNADLNTRTVDTHMSRLRRKLTIGEENGWKLTAIYQHGYRLERVGDGDDAGGSEASSGDA